MTYRHPLSSQPFLFLGVMTMSVVGHAGDHFVNFI